MGQKRVYQPEPPKPSDLSTIMYTSGTTGLNNNMTNSMTGRTVDSTIAWLAARLTA